MSRDSTTIFFTIFLALASVGMTSARWSRQDTRNCTAVTTFENVESLTELEGHWYILGLSERFMENFKLTCFTWNATTSEKKAKIHEMVLMRDGAHSFTQETFFYIDLLLPGTFSIRKPHWGTTLQTDANLVGVSGNQAVVIKCRDGEKSQIVALTRRSSDSLNSILVNFGLPTSLDTYAALDELDQAGCESVATEATTTQTETSTGMTSDLPNISSTGAQSSTESTSDEQSSTGSTSDVQSSTGSTSDVQSSTGSTSDAGSTVESTSDPTSSTESTSDVQSSSESTTTAPTCILTP